MDRLFTLSGYESCISQDFFPAIELDSSGSYTLGLYGFNVFNSIPNVQRGKNDKFHFSIVNDEGQSTDTFVVIPEGGYEIDAIEKFLHDALLEKHEALLGSKFNRGKYYFGMRANLSTLEVIISASFAVDFTKPSSIGQLLGFDNVLIKAGDSAKSNSVVKITSVDAVNIECNIITGSYIMGKPSHTLYSFDPNVVPPGYKISLYPSNVLYLPLNTNYISNITLRLVDHKGEDVNFRGEHIVVQLNLRRFN